MDYALRKEEEANREEEMKRNANREAALQYKKYLEELMIKEVHFPYLLLICKLLLGVIKINGSSSYFLIFLYYLQAEDTAFVDEINKREEEKVWKARDDALKAREDARQYLMQAVDEGRKQQIASKREMSEKEREEGQLFARKFLDEASEAVQRYCQL